VCVYVCVCVCVCVWFVYVVSVRSTVDYWLDCSDSSMALTSVPDGGFGRTIETFVTDAGIDDKILTNSIVKSIDYTEKESVTVAYANKGGDLIHVKAPTSAQIRINTIQSCTSRIQARSR